MNATKSKIDLRQELLNLNLGIQDFDSWLGKKFDEAEEYEDDPYDDRFTHDIPLQRSISLDRGVDVFNHLRTLGSDWTESNTNSTWSVNSEGKDSFIFKQCRSLEDIPASQLKVKSRRASSDVANAFSERNIALAALKDSYKGLDGSGSLSPQIKRLKRCFTYSGSFENMKESRNSTENLQRLKPPKIKIENCPVSPQIKKLQYFAFRNSFENIDSNKRLEVHFPLYRSKSGESTNKESDLKPPQSRSGLQGIFAKREETNLRKGVLEKQMEFRGWDNKRREHLSRWESPETQASTQNTLLVKSSYKDVIFEGSISEKLSNLRRIFGITEKIESRDVPKIVVLEERVAKIVPDTSNYVEVRCDCRICNDDNDKGFIRNLLSKLLVNIIKCRDYGRKLYWDENNYVSEDEMYRCIMHVLKLMLGLWLRHLDHN